MRFFNSRASIDTTVASTFMLARSTCASWIPKAKCVYTKGCAVSPRPCFARSSPTVRISSWAASASSAGIGSPISVPVRGSPSCSVTRST